MFMKELKVENLTFVASYRNLLILNLYNCFNNFAHTFKLQVINASNTFATFQAYQLNNDHFIVFCYFKLNTLRMFCFPHVVNVVFDKYYYLFTHNCISIIIIFQEKKQHTVY